MADRSVSVKLELDVASYLANLKAAQEATKSFGEKTGGSTSKADDEVKNLGKDIEDVGKKSDQSSKKIQSNNLADQHSYSDTRTFTLALGAALANLPAIVAPALGLLLAVPGAIATAGIAAITAEVAFKGFGNSLKALESNDVTKISKAMQDMSPTAQGFALEIQGVREQWNELKQSVQGEAFAPLIGSLNQLSARILPMLNEELPQVGRSVGEVGAGFASWLGQTDTMGKIALMLQNVRDQVQHILPFLTAWGDAFLSISNTAGPFLVKLIDMMTQLGNRFTAFLDNARNTGQLDTLFKTTAVGVQGLLDLLAKLADTLFTVLASPGTLAAAKVLFATFTAIADVLDTLANGLAALPAPLQAVLLVMLAIGGTTPLLAKGFSGIKTALVEAGSAIEKTIGWFGNLGSSTETATASTQKFGFAAKEAGTASSAASKGASGLVSAFGGPWGLAIAGATVGIGLLVSALGASKQKADEATQAYEQFGQAVRDAQAAGTQNIPQLISQNKAVQELILTASKYGVSSADLVSALSGEKVSLETVTSALSAKREELVKVIAAHTQYGARTGPILDETGQKARAAVQQIDGLTEGLDKNAQLFGKAQEAQAKWNADAGKTAGLVGSNAAQILSLTALLDVMNSKTATTAQLNDAFTKTLKGINESAAPAGDTLRQLSGFADDFNGVALTASDRATLFKTILSDINTTSGTTEDKVKALTQVFDDIASSELSASDKATLLKQSWEAIHKPGIDAKIAAEDFTIALDDLHGQIDKNNKTMDDSTAVGAKNTEMVRGLIQKNVDLYFANINSGMSADKARAIYDTNARQIEVTGQKTGIATDKVHALNVQYGDMPTSKNTNVTITGAAAVFNQLVNLKAAQLALAQNIDVGQAAKEVHNQVGQGIGGLATGGYLDGPGTKTSDSILIRASRGEYMQQASAVDYYGVGFMDALNKKQIPRNAIPGYAGGGWPFPVNVSGTKIPKTLAQIQQDYINNMVTTGAGGNWVAVAQAVATALGQAGSWPAIVRRINFESGGNATIVNKTDSNWIAGHPSVGLAQVIAGTFAAYAGAYRNVGPFEYGVSVNPYANVYAGMNYATHRYGSIAAVDPLRMHSGYAGGGLIPLQSYDKGGWLQPGLTLAYNGTRAPEAVGGGGGGGQIHLTVNAGMGVNGPQLGQQIADSLRTFIRNSGGNVQVALGRRGA